MSQGALVLHQNENGGKRPALSDPLRDGAILKAANGSPFIAAEHPLFSGILGVDYRGSSPVRALFSFRF